MWYELVTVMSQVLKYDVITYTPYESLNYTILDKITPLWKRIGELPEIQISCYRATQVNSFARAHHTICSDWIKPFDNCVTEIPFAFILAGIIVALWC